jgi:hypothetical protein
MSDATDGRGLVSDDFDDDEIDGDDEESVAEPDGLSPIEAMVADSMDVVVPEDDAVDDDSVDDDSADTSSDHDDHD